MIHLIQMMHKSLHIFIYIITAWSFNIEIHGIAMRQGKVPTEKVKVDLFFSLFLFSNTVHEQTIRTSMFLL